MALQIFTRVFVQVANYCRKAKEIKFYKENLNIENAGENQHSGSKPSLLLSKRWGYDWRASW